MRLALILSVILVGLCSPSSSIYAAAMPSQETLAEEEPVQLNPRELQNWKRTIERRTKDYDTAVEALFSSRNNVQNQIYMIRSQYASTMHYSPFSDILTDRMTRYAYIIDTSKDSEEVNEAQANYNELLRNHVADLGVAKFALSMSRLNVRYGDEYFLKDVVDAIIKCIKIHPGLTDGKTSDSAYRIVTFAEENQLLEEVGGVVKKSETFHVRNKFYNVHDLADENGELERVFIDVSEPMRMSYIIKKIKERDVILNAPEERPELR